MSMTGCQSDRTDTCLGDADRCQTDKAGYAETGSRYEPKRSLHILEQEYGVSHQKAELGIAIAEREKSCLADWTMSRDSVSM